MNRKYQITLLGMALDTSLCPPPIVSALWPTFDGWPCQLDGNTLLVSVPASAPAPTDLGPLVKVELVTSE